MGRRAPSPFLLWATSSCDWQRAEALAGLKPSPGQWHQRKCPNLVSDQEPHRPGDACLSCGVAPMSPKLSGRGRGMGARGQPGGMELCRPESDGHGDLTFPNPDLEAGGPRKEAPRRA